MFLCMVESTYENRASFEKVYSVAERRREKAIEA